MKTAFLSTTLAAAFCLTAAANATPFSPPSGPATGSFNGLHRESNFLAIGEPGAV